jgi:DUF1365 family protein
MSRRRAWKSLFQLSFAYYLSHPLLAIKVVVGLHLEALALWVKGMRLQIGRHRPATL